MACTRRKSLLPSSTITQQQLWNQMFPKVLSAGDSVCQDKEGIGTKDTGRGREYRRRSSVIEPSVGLLTRRRIIPQEDAMRKPLDEQEGERSFDEIRRKCIKERRLFEDASFPAVDSSVFHSRNTNKRFQWKRPGVSLYSVWLYCQ